MSSRISPDKNHWIALKWAQFSPLLKIEEVSIGLTTLSIKEQLLRKHPQGSESRKEAVMATTSSNLQEDF